MPTVAIDTTGPAPLRDRLIAAVADVSRSSDIECLVVGDPAAIQAVLDHASYDPEQIAIIECTDDRGLDAGIRAMAAGRADALVVEGTPGHCLRGALARAPLLPGIRRPAVTHVYPRVVESEESPRFAMLLDVEGTTATVEDLAGWAVLASAHMRRSVPGPKPRVGTLTGALPDLADLGRRLGRYDGLVFVGPVSGSDLLGAAADIVVCDGSHGRLARELLDAITPLVESPSAADDRTRSWRTGFGWLATTPTTHPLADWTGYPGAPVLGFERTIVRCDGHTTVAAVAHVITESAKALSTHTPAAIAAAVAAVA